MTTQDNNEAASAPRTYAERALFEANREGVRPEYRLVMLRQRDHEKAERFAQAQECAAIRFDLEQISDLAHRAASASQPSTAGDSVDEITERIRLSSGSHTGKGKIQLHHEVEHLLGHIALLKSGLAHVARQRQEPIKHKLSDDERAALAKAAETGATVAELPNGGLMFINRGHDLGDNAHLECPGCGGSGHIDDYRQRQATPSAAVAEGVDTAEFPKVAARFYMTEATKENPWRKESFSIAEEHRQKVEGVRGFHTPALEFITVEQGLTYGAQQREAGRREVSEELEITDKLLAERNRVLQAIPGCEAHGDQCVPHALEWIAAALARQPVSEGLTMLSGALNHAREALRFYANQEHFHMHQPDEWDMVSGEPQNFYEDSNNTATVEDGTVAKWALEDVAQVEAYASIADDAAVPPAKAEGMSDTERKAARYEFLRAGTHEIFITPGPDEGNGCPAIMGEIADAAIDRAILAQQSKGEQQ